MFNAVSETVRFCTVCLCGGLHSCLCRCYFLLVFAGWVGLRLAVLAIIVAVMS